jgi:hypothetical protein
LGRGKKEAGPLADGPALLSGEEGTYQRARASTGVVIQRSRRATVEQVVKRTNVAGLPRTGDKRSVSLETLGPAPRHHVGSRRDSRERAATLSNVNHLVA